MKLWLKLLIVCVSGAIVWGLSFLSSIKPEMAMMLASINVAVVAVSSFFTGYPGPKA
jgi:hypothetical protein